MREGVEVEVHADHVRGHAALARPEVRLRLVEAVGAELPPRRQLRGAGRAVRRVGA